jgi:hypothetical protein
MLPGPAAGLEVVEHGLLPHLEALCVHEVAVGAGRVVAHHLQQPCSLKIFFIPRREQLKQSLQPIPKCVQSERDSVMT